MSQYFHGFGRFTRYCQYISNFGSQITYSFVKCGCSIYFYLSILQTWYVYIRISRSISESSLDIEITSIDCIFLWYNNSRKQIVVWFYVNVPKSLNYWNIQKPDHNGLLFVFRSWVICWTWWETERKPQKPSLNEWLRSLTRLKNRFRNLRTKERAAHQAPWAPWAGFLLVAMMFSTHLNSRNLRSLSIGR